MNEQYQMDEEEAYYEQQQNDGFPQDPNIQEYQQNDNDGDTKMHRTRGSGRSATNNGERARTPGSKYEMGNTRTIQESMGHLKQIVSGKNHILQLTRDGYVFSYGASDFSVSGHGGSKVVTKPQLVKHLSDKRVVQIACGEYHSLVLTDRNDVYSWGRGYEGQLGVSESIEVATKPNYVKGFFGVPVIYIAAGAYYSLAITHENKLYGWGEARLGQLGLGVKTRMVRTPTYISVRESEETVGNKNISNVSVKEEIPRLDTNEAKIVYCSAGLGHTMAISDEGELYTWGFNN
jgi:alpha-tubulin suppressor-like RCC1 family protein